MSPLRCFFYLSGVLTLTGMLILDALHEFFLEEKKTMGRKGKEN